MSATQLPAAVHAIAGQPTITGYTVESWVTNAGGDIQSEDIFDAAGAFKERIVYEKRLIKVSGVLMAQTGSTFSEFPEAAMCTATSWTKYKVLKCTVTRTKGVLRGEIEMEKIDFSV